MSWFNSGLNTLKGIAQEVLLESEKSEDEVNFSKALEEYKKQNEELVLQCNTKDTEIASLRKQITILEKNASLEGSWICEPENLPSDSSGKNDSNERNSESSSGGEMITIPLDNTVTSESESWEKIHKTTEDKDQILKKLLQENSKLKEKITQLTVDNQELTENLDVLDSQHNIAIQELLELKNNFQSKFVNVSVEYETLKKQHEKFVIDSQKDLENLKIKLETRYENELELLHESIEKLEKHGASLKKACEAKDEHILELLEKTNKYENDFKKTKIESDELVIKLQNEIVELKELLKKSEEDKEEERKIDNKTGQQDSSESISKQGSEDGFIVLQHDNETQQTTDSWEKKYGDAKEEQSILKQKLTELENCLSKLEEEREEIQNELKFQEQNNVSLKDKIEKYSDIIWKLEKELENSKRNEDIFQKKIKDYEVELKSANEKNIEYENKLKLSIRQDQEIKDIQKTLTVLKNENLELRNETESLRRNIKEDIDNECNLKELETKLNEMKLTNRVLKCKFEEQKSTISELNETITKCEANASDVESKLMMENVDLQKKIIDMESLKNEKHTETVIINAHSASKFEQIRELLSTYLHIDTNLEDLSSIKTIFKNIQEKVSKLEICENNLKQMTEDNSKLKSEKSAIEHEKLTLQADIVHYEEECEELMKNNEVLLNELENLKRNKLETITENDEESIVILEKQLEESNNLNRTLEEEYKQLHRRIEEIEFDKQELVLKVQTLQDLNENLENKLKTLKQQKDSLEEENCRLIFEINEMKTDDKKSAIESEMNEFKVINQNLEKQLESLSKDHADLVTAMHSQQSAFIEYKKETEIAVETLNRELKEKNVIFISKEDECQKKEKEIELLQHQLTETSKNIETLEEKLENLNKKFDELTQENHDIKENYTSVKNENNELVIKCQDLEQKNIQTEITFDDKSKESQQQIESEINELRQTIETLTNEKNNLIQVVTVKHNENIQYYTEIQRLDQLLKTEIEKSQNSSQNSNCENCLKLQNNISDIEHANKNEIEKLIDQINFLKEKSDILTTNLLTEQTNQKLLLEEKMNLTEQNNNLSRDLERLRQHLVELEESHTQETIEMQNIIDETKTKMMELQKEMANSSNAYTSASIRANQHTETLQAQYQLVSQQRDELATKLSRAEDRESKNQAALINLQCALEQFQIEKDKEILLATNRIRKELQNEQNKQKELQIEIESLNHQLDEANQGLLAATRLSSQLETCQMTITSLKEQITKLENLNQLLEEKLHNNEINQSDKIEKSLIKSLIIGYIVSSNQNDKIQILRMISSILNFNQIEINKIGLNRMQSGWFFSGLLQGNNPSESSNSSSGNSGGGDGGLVKAFVEFLEKESQPRNNNNTTKMPNLLNLVSSDSSSSSDTNISTNDRKISTDKLSTSSSLSHSQHHVQPILVNESILEQFAPTRNSSSILKDILSDN